MKRNILVILAVCALSSLSAQSLTETVGGYKNAVIQSGLDSHVFEKFRRNKYIVCVYEHVSKELGKKYYQAIMKDFQGLVSKATEFQENDIVGSPILVNYPEIGSFSPVTLRYMFILGEIQKLFDLESDCKIVEIGCGYGGQCSIISKAIDFSNYQLIDLEFTLPLIDRYLSALSVKNFTLKASYDSSLQGKYDLFISNYAISECARKDQDIYIENVIRHCRCGYITYNRIYDESYTIDEFCSQLRAVGIDPVVIDETIQTFPMLPNKLIYWGERK